MNTIMPLSNTPVKFTATPTCLACGGTTFSKAFYGPGESPAGDAITTKVLLLRCSGCGCAFYMSTQS